MYGYSSCKSPWVVYIQIKLDYSSLPKSAGTCFSYMNIIEYEYEYMNTIIYMWIYEYIYIEYMNIYLYMYIEYIRQLLWIQDVWIICSQVPLRRFLPFYPNPQGVDHLGTHHLFVHICSMNYLAAIHHNRLFIMKMCYKTPYTPYITIIFLWFDSFDSP